MRDMKTCPYCGSGVQNHHHHYYCGFCKMKLDRSEVQENGKRKNLLPQQHPTIEDAKKPTPELMKLSTVELLCLLKLARKERSDTYNNRYIFIQALKQGAKEFSDAEQYTFKEYEYWTRKCFVIENLIRERIGFIPKKINKEFIQNMIQRMQQPVKDMNIQPPKKEVERVK